MKLIPQLRKKTTDRLLFDTVRSKGHRYRLHTPQRNPSCSKLIKHGFEIIYFQKIVIRLFVSHLCHFGILQIQIKFDGLVHARKLLFQLVLKRACCCCTCCFFLTAVGLLLALFVVKKRRTVAKNIHVVNSLPIEEEDSTNTLTSKKKPGRFQFEYRENERASISLTYA